MFDNLVDISVSVKESEKIGNQRFIEGCVLEVADSIPRTETKGRTDWFDGTSFTLTLEQAEALYLQLGSSLVLAKSLVSSGEVKVKS
ncbi:hypothetical protein AB835_08300 [Candidatus Endobugula sertula]|uniref:Uncharacterized protein n=1 Tax=Candidatus Endobugula sertula TaxID=62101 RepID=A0A1D2QPZ7_9GAMM|nr:hypothetical protein AB835_08300 [Candidatus Endobugula sertula]